MYSDYFKDWRVGDNYKLKGWIGKGSYGEVAEAEAPNGEKVAVKRIRGLFRDRVDTIRTLREIHILRHLQQHPNIILLKDILIPEDRYSFTEIYVVFEFFDTDLRLIIQSPQFLKQVHVQTFLYQILCGLKYIHDSGVIHRDLKPANILLNQDCTLALCDFGLSRVVSGRKPAFLRKMQRRGQAASMSSPLTKSGSASASGSPKPPPAHPAPVRGNGSGVSGNTAAKQADDPSAWPSPRGDLDFDELWMDEDLSVNKEGGEWPDWGYYNSTSGDVGQNTPTATKEDAAGSRRRLVENLPSTVNVTRARSYSLVEQAQRAPAISPGDWPFGPPVDSDVYSQVYQDVFGTDAPSASPSNSQQGGGSSKRQRVEAHHTSSTAEDTPAGRGQKVRFSGVRRERAASAPASSLLTMAEGKKAPRQGRMSGIEEATGQGSGSSEEDGDKEEDAVDQLLDIHQHEIPADEGTREAGGQVTEPSSRGADSGDSEEAEGRINSHSSQGSFDSEFQEEDDDIGFEPMQRTLTHHVVTRWYRAPELILLQSYGFEVDIWSCGCIFAELLSMQRESVQDSSLRFPLFPGRSCFPLSADTPMTYKDKLDQLNLIFGVIGTPEPEDLEHVQGDVRQYLASLRPVPPKNFRSMFPGAPPEALDLLRSMLRFNPKKRITVNEALNHPYIRPSRLRCASTQEGTEPSEDVPGPGEQVPGSRVELLGSGIDVDQVLGLKFDDAEEVGEGAWERVGRSGAGGGGGSSSDRVGSKRGMSYTPSSSAKTGTQFGEVYSDRFSIDTLRELMYREILLFHQQPDPGIPSIPSFQPSR